MSVTPEQVVAAAKSNVDASLKSSVAAVSSVFNAVESLSALNLKTARASFDDGVAFVKAVAAVKDPKELVALQVGLLMPSVEKVVAYGRAVAAIGASVKSELSAQAEADLASLMGQLNSSLETLFKNAPAGSEAAVSAVKTAIANATSAYEGATKAAKQVAEAAQASIETATAAAVENLSKGTKSVASALQVAA